VTTERVTFMEVKDNENLVNTMILKRAPHILREQLPKKNVIIEFTQWTRFN